MSTKGRSSFNGDINAVSVCGRDWLPSAHFTIVPANPKKEWTELTPNHILQPAANIKDVNFCKGHRDKTEVPDPVAVEDLISHNFNNRQKLARLITQYRNIHFWRHGLPSSGCYRLLHNLLTRPNKVETGVHGCNSFGFQFVLCHNIVPFCFYVVSALYH